MHDMNEKQPSKLCQEFADILNATPSVINGVCTATRSRENLHSILLGRRAESFMFVPQAFSFEPVDKNGKSLCLGETVILQDEVNPFISILRKNGILVTAFHNHWLFEDPRLMYIHFESIDQPLDFARKTREALNVLTRRNIGGDFFLGFRRGIPIPEKLCEEFHDILGGTATFDEEVCMVMRSRLEIRPIILGRRTDSFLAIPQMFAFESLSPDGRALCSGETVLLEEEFNPLASQLRKRGIQITAFHNHWLFDKPRLMYIHFVKIDDPIRFAMDVKESLRVLRRKK